MAKKKRRYLAGKFPAYDRAYDQAANDSNILNPETRNLTNDYRLSNPKSGLMELVGEPGKDGKYQLKDEWRTASIPLYKAELKELHLRFKAWGKQQVEKGLALKPPKEWPTELLELRLKKEAILDVRRREAFRLKKLIKEKQEEKTKERRGPVLPHGPLGKGGHKPDPGAPRLWTIDGQRIKESAEGIPYLNEPESPYHKMTLFHYKRMTKKWVQDMGLTLELLRERRDKIHAEEVKEAHQAGEEPPGKKLIVTHSKIPQWIDRIGITRDDWPEVPEGSLIDDVEKETAQ